MADNDPTEIAAAEAVVKRIWECFLSRDREGMEACLHPDCTIWDVFTSKLVRDPESKRAYIEADFKQSMKRGKLTHALLDFVTDVWGDAAIVRFNSNYNYDPPSPASGRNRTTCVPRKISGAGWLVIHVHEGALPTGIPPLED